MFATYLAKEHDNDTTVVDGIRFKSDEPVDVSHKSAEFVAKLRKNPWFHVGEESPPISEKRKLKIAAKRQRAAELRAEADRLLTETGMGRPAWAASQEPEPASTRSEADALVNKLAAETDTKH